MAKSGRTKQKEADMEYNIAKQVEKMLTYVVLHNLMISSRLLLPLLWDRLKQKGIWRNLRHLPFVTRWHPLCIFLFVSISHKSIDPLCMRGKIFLVDCFDLLPQGIIFSSQVKISSILAFPFSSHLSLCCVDFLQGSARASIGGMWCYTSWKENSS